MILLWDAGTTEHKTTFQGHTGRINSLAFSPDGTMLASADSTIRIWDIKTGKQHAKFINLVPEHHENPLPITAVVFSPDGKTVASIDQSADIQLWNIHTGKHKTTFKAHPERTSGIFMGNFYLEYSPDGTTLISTGYDSTISIWDIKTGKHQETLKGHTVPVMSLAYSADGTTLVSGSTDGALLWQMKSSPETRLNITPFSAESPSIGERLTFDINMSDAQNVTEYKFTLQYNTKALRYIPNAESATKIKNVKRTDPVIARNSITLAGKATPGSRIEDGIIATVTFEVIKPADVILTLTDAHLTNEKGKLSLPVPVRAWVVKPPPIPGDVNQDWRLDAADLEFVSSRLGQTGKGNKADVNEDGIVDLADLVLVANALNDTISK